MTHSQAMQKLKVVFVAYSSLKMDGGAVNLLFHYIAAAPKSVEIVVLQTDYCPLPRLSDDQIREGLSGAKLVTLNGASDQKILGALSGFFSRGIGLALVELLVWPFQMYLTRLTKEYRNIRDELSDADVVTFIAGENHYSSLFSGMTGKVIGSPHGWVPKRNTLLQRLEISLIRNRLIWRRIDGFITYPHNSWFASINRRKFNLVLSNGVDATLFYPSNFRSGKVKFLFVAYLEECKGISILLSAWRSIMDTVNAELHVCGAGSLEDEVSHCPGVKYHGFPNVAELSRVYRECDAFIFPTKCDAFGLVILEALASGLYVVTDTSLRGIYDEFEELSWLEYATRSPAVIAERMRWICDNVKNIRERDVSRLRHLITEKYDWHSLSRQLFDFFNDISARKEG